MAMLDRHHEGDGEPTGQLVRYRCAARAIVSLFLVICASEAATLAAGPPPPSAETLAWFLGRRWTEAALTHARAEGGQRDIPDKLFKASQTLADALGVTVPPLFKCTGDRTKDTATALNYILTNGTTIESDPKAGKGPKAAVLFSLARQVVLARLLYEQDGDMRTTLASNIEKPGQQSGSPRSAWQPTVAAIRARQPSEKVNDELSQLMKSVEAVLMPRSEGQVLRHEDFRHGPGRGR